MLSNENVARLIVLTLQDYLEWLWDEGGLSEKYWDAYDELKVYASDPSPSRAPAEPAEEFDSGRVGDNNLGRGPGDCERVIAPRERLPVGCMRLEHRIEPLRELEEGREGKVAVARLAGDTRARACLGVAPPNCSH